MSQTAKLFRNGRSQAVRLPSEYRFEGSEVYVRRDPSTGDVIDVKTRKIVTELSDENGRPVHSEKMVEIVFNGEDIESKLGEHLRR